MKLCEVLIIFDTNEVTTFLQIYNSKRPCKKVVRESRVDYVCESK